MARKRREFRGGVAEENPDTIDSDMGADNGPPLPKRSSTV